MVGMVTLCPKVATRSELTRKNLPTPISVFLSLWVWDGLGVVTVW